MDRKRSDGEISPVRLDCRPVDIAPSVGRFDAAVYSPPVLRLQGQSAYGHRIVRSERLEIGLTDSLRQL